jgi:F-type H+-transporting ATPase subunit a
MEDNTVSDMKFIANSEENVTNTSQESHNQQSEHKTEGEHAEATKDVFQELYKQMGDHYGLVLGPYHVSDLPMIFIDNGFHFYPSVKAMEDGGQFTMVHHQPVRTDTHQPPQWDFSITNLVFFQLMALVVLAIVFFRTGSKYKKAPSQAPKGFANMIESVIMYVRDQIVRPNLPSVHVADRLLPYLAGLFFFILTLNLFGLIPFGHTATGTIAVTAGLAITAFLVINITAIRESGIGAWFKHLLGGAPWWLFPVMIPIELLSMFIKPFALTIRLFANMSAGHVVLLSILGLLFYFKTIMISPLIVGFSVFIYFLELLVAFIQAYVFTMLTTIFIGLAIGEHGHDEHGQIEHSH